MIPMQYSGIWKSALSKLSARLSAVDQEFDNAIRQLKALRDRLAQPLHDVFQREAGAQMRTIAAELETLSRLTLTFNTTETWRTIYEEVLAGCQYRRYLSVALIDSDGYWRDHPGECSLKFNYRLIDGGYFVHRLFIIDDYYWPPAAKLPETDLMRWIHVQYAKGIEISLVRISELQLETNLITDLGIYGSEAVGYQATTEDGRTARYDLHFDITKVTEAEQRWNKLQLYAIRLETLLDQNANRG